LSSRRLCGISLNRETPDQPSTRRFQCPLQGDSARLDPRQPRRRRGLRLAHRFRVTAFSAEICLGFRRRFWLARLDIRARAATGLTASSRRGGRIDGAAFLGDHPIRARALGGQHRLERPWILGKRPGGGLRHDRDEVMSVDERPVTRPTLAPRVSTPALRGRIAHSRSDVYGNSQ
jgi:hypothetical protein